MASGVRWFRAKPDLRKHEMLVMVHFILRKGVVTHVTQEV